jgi:hypothetical protein
LGVGEREPFGEGEGVSVNRPVKPASMALLVWAVCGIGLLAGCFAIEHDFKFAADKDAIIFFRGYNVQLWIGREARGDGKHFAVVVSSEFANQLSADASLDLVPYFTIDSVCILGDSLARFCPPPDSRSDRYVARGTRPPYRYKGVIYGPYRAYQEVELPATCKNVHAIVYLTAPVEGSIEPSVSDSLVYDLKWFTKHGWPGGEL